MGKVKCPSCEKTFIRPGEEDGETVLCGTCHSSKMHQLNKIDREYTMKDDQNLNNSEYQEKFQRMHKKRVRRVNHALKSIPPNLMPADLAQMAEEIKDPENKNRKFCIGTLDEIEMTEDGIQLKDRYDPHK